MAARLYYLTAILLWLASMTWLVIEKVIPPLLGGSPPDYQSALAEPQEEPDYWKITWNRHRIGSVITQVIDREEGGCERRNLIQFEDLPLESMLSELLGTFAPFAHPLPGGSSDFKTQAVLATRLKFDDTRRLTGFRTVLDLDDTPNFLTITGKVVEQTKLAIVVRIAGAWNGVGTDDTEWHHELDLPRDALVGDAFTPRMELKNLHVGQSWTIPVYRPFPPNSPVQIVEAEVKRHDIIIWEGNDVETMLVVYRTDAGTGLRATNEPTAREWVRADGLVLRQELVYSGLTMQFERRMEQPVDRAQAILDEGVHPRYWSEERSTERVDADHP